MTKRQIFTTARQEKRERWIQAGKIGGIILALLGIALLVMAIINKFDIYLGVVGLVLGVTLFLMSYMYSKRNPSGILWVENDILYMKGGGLPDGYFRVVPLQTVRDIDYNPRSQEYTIRCQNNMAYADKATNRLKVISQKDTFEGYDTYKPSLIRFLKNECGFKVREQEPRRSGFLK